MKDKMTGVERGESKKKRVIWGNPFKKFSRLFQLVKLTLILE